jgi:hypothetical protein
MGLSSFDLLGDIPPSHKTLMKLFLRRVQLSAADLETAVAELPPEKAISKEDLRVAIAALVQQGWLKQSEQNGKIIYSIKQITTGH